MKILVVEDDFASRLLLQRLLESYGEIHLATNGQEAIAAYLTAEEIGEPYELICLDVMMPEMDGQEVLATIREYERDRGFHVGQGAKIIMVTALDDSRNIMTAFREQCDAYLTKPIDRKKLIAHLESFGFAA